MSLQKNESYLKDLMTAIEGMKAGGEKTVKTTLPDEFAKEEYAGAKVNIEVKLLEIKEKMLPDVTDDFAKSVGNLRLSKICVKKLYSCSKIKKRVCSEKMVKIK